jgi:hypothetical protein
VLSQVLRLVGRDQISPHTQPQVPAVQGQENHGVVGVETEQMRDGSDQLGRVG